MKLTRDDTGYTLADYTPFDLALLSVGSERSATTAAMRFYSIDRPSARLLVRIARKGNETTP